MSVPKKGRYSSKRPITYSTLQLLYVIQRISSLTRQISRAPSTHSPPSLGALPNYMHFTPQSQYPGQIYFRMQKTELLLLRNHARENHE